jgi:putative DNA primase/helicase
MTDHTHAFAQAMHDAGLTPPSAIKADGSIHRFHVSGDKRGTRNGWYLLHLNGRAAGAFGSWKAGFSSTWAADGEPMSRAEREAFRVMLDNARKRAEAERRAEHEARATEARAEWAQAGPADPAHPYLLTKGVQPHTLRQIGDTLIVPLLDQYGMLWNVQRIQPDGGKRFRPGRAGGLFSPIGDLTNPAIILICEGWATGATLHQETGHPVLCAMNAGNLLPVAKAARAAWAGADLVICADNDRFTEGNPGVTYATAAAKATGARLAVPEFPDGTLGTDFNDLALLRKGGVSGG